MNILLGILALLCAWYFFAEARRIWRLDPLNYVALAMVVIPALAGIVQLVIAAVLFWGLN